MKTDLELNEDVLNVRHCTRVEATDGYVGLVDELLISPNNRQVTHIVLRERHVMKKRGITIPVSLIDHVYGDIIFLKLDLESVEALPTISIQRWPL